MRKHVSADFFERVVPEPNTGCRLWSGPRNRGGYGVFWFERPTQQMAHHVAWRLHHGTWPTLHVLHKCDTPACVNPDHLFAGTHQDNMRDAARKGRFGRLFGDRSSNHKLTEARVAEIRARRDSGEMLKDLAAAFGVSKSCIHAVCTGKNWRRLCTS